MSLVRHDRNGLRSLFDELDDLVHSNFDLLGRELSTERYPNVDIIEEDKGYKLLADMPGVPKEKIQINVSANMISISGEKEQTREKVEKGYNHYERQYGRFSRIFNLPDNVDQSKIEAHYTNGVLNVFIPKTAKEPKKAVDIKID